MTAAGDIRAVLLDLDDTLFDHRYCAREALLGVRNMHQALAAVDATTLEQSHARILEELHVEVLKGRLELDAARIERFRRLYLASGVQADMDLVSRTAAAYRAGYIEARRPIQGAADFLEALRERARIVVVSNNLLLEQRDKLRGCGLDRYVDALVVSEEVGVAKPAVRIFEVALERAGVRAGEAVMIGDSWANDVEGARAAGIRAVWFNRDGNPSPDAAVPVLRSLELSSGAMGVIFGDAGLLCENAFQLVRSDPEV